MIIVIAEAGGHADPVPGLADAARRFGDGLKQVGERHVDVLREPTADDAIRVVKQAVRDAANAGETLVVYVGGYGRIGSDGDLVLLTSDTIPGRQGTGLRTRELHEILDAPHLPSPRMLVLDSPHADTAVMRHSWGPNTAVLCSVPAGAEVLDPADLRLGFTGWVARGVTRGEADLDGDGIVDIGELCRYVTDGLAREGTAQRPVLLINGPPADFVISRNPHPARRRQDPDEQRSEVLPPPIEPFVDRTAQLQALRSVLGEPPDRGGEAPLVVALTGAAGMGKTQLAVRVAVSLRNRYPHGVLYASAGPGHAAAVTAFASALGFRPDQSQHDPASFLQEATAHLAVLFLLDDVDSDIDVNVTLPVGPRCAVLVAGRAPNIVPAVTAPVSLPPLDEEATRALFEQVIRRPGAKIDVDTVLSRAGGNPLFVRLLGAAGEPGTQGKTPKSLQDAIALRYDSLPPSAATLFRRAVLAGQEGLDDEVAEILLEGAGDGKAIDALVASGLVVPLPDGRATFVSGSIHEFAAQRLKTGEEKAKTKALRERVHLWLQTNRQYQLEPRITRDYWTTKDKLGYAPYADAVAAFIRHRATLPPLTIGIKAPWGAGKTSLMRMVQDRLDPPADKTGAARPIRLTAKSRSRLRGGRRRHSHAGEPDPAFLTRDTQTGAAVAEPNIADKQAKRADKQATRHVTNREVLKQAKKARANGPDPPLLQAKPDATSGLVDGWRATVWFNPWIYQSSEQIWAGFAYEIIRQITCRLRVGDRERFWLELNLARLNTDAIRRRAYRAIWGRVLPFLVVAAVATAVSLFAFTVERFTGAAWLRTLGGVVAGGGGLAIASVLVSAMRFFTGTASGSFTALLRGPDLAGSVRSQIGQELTDSFDAVITDPGYATKLGFLHLVQADMKHVLRLVATERRPLVVFIDDLDRCSPGTVAQVIEAINLFLAGEFPDCIFVLAIEPALVAAHIEVAYKDLAMALHQDHAPGEWATLGWRFLEKIVQLPLSLPAPQDTRWQDSYLGSLLTLDGVADAGRTAPSEASITVTRAVATYLRRARTLMAARIGQGNIRGHRSIEPGGHRMREPGSALAREIGRSTHAADAGARPGPDTASIDPAEGIDPALVEKLTDKIRARRPTAATLLAVARQVQAESAPHAGQDELLPAISQAANRVRADLYSDADAVNAIGDALPALSSANPREIKRFINLFRFYTFIVQHQQLHGVTAPDSASIAKLAALAIRWPHLLSLLSQRPTEVTSPMSVLERGARAARDPKHDPWQEALIDTGLLTEMAVGEQSSQLPGWSRDLRDFLATGPEVGEAAARLL